MERGKEAFMERFGKDYGYPDAVKSIDDIRASEFKRLEGLVYLDHAGATLYSEAQMEASVKDLTTNVYGNPPRVIPAWQLQASLVQHDKRYALDHGATAVAVDVENITNLQNGTHNSRFVFSEHTVQRRPESLSLKHGQNGKLSGSAFNLFAFPSECNFSGQKFSLDLVNYVKEGAGEPFKSSPDLCGRWMVLIDAAKGSATEPPDLARFHADFVVCSFYKIFGYPTGLGALIIHSETARILTKTYFSGGTVSASIADVDFIKRRENIEQVLEDGTLSFLAIASIHHGFMIINRLTSAAIFRHTTSLASYTRDVMMGLKHANGVEACNIYGKFLSDIGPTIAFNLRRADGSWVGYREVDKLASLSGIQLRTGCFCNPGACAKYLDLSHSDLIANLEAGHVCWDDNDILCGKPTGAVRISFGYMSTYEDAENFLRFLDKSFVSKSDSSADIVALRLKIDPLSDLGSKQLVHGIQLKSITIYPVKSCAGFTVHKWPLSNIGLKYDREWLLKGPTGEIITQKKVPEMCNIQTFIDLEKGVLILESPRCKERLQVSILKDSQCEGVLEMNIFNQRYNVRSYNNEVNRWFAEAIAWPCTLVRCSSSEYRSCNNTRGTAKTCRDTWGKLNFVNEAQLLLVSEESVCDLNSRLNSNILVDHGQSAQTVPIDAMRFRPNLVISGVEPYTEDTWRSLYIGKAHFSSLGGCSRCQMINLDQQSGQLRRSKEPLATLASYRRVKGKILFGILLRYEGKDYDGEQNNGAETWLQVGQEVYASIE